MTGHEPDQATSHHVHHEHGSCVGQHAVVEYDPPASAPVGATIRVTGSGTVTVHRDHGCTLDNVRELCEAVVGGELTIVDLTELDA